MKTIIGIIDCMAGKRTVAFHAVKLILFILSLVVIPTAFADEFKQSISDSVFFGMPPVKDIKQNKNLVKNECLQKYFKVLSPDSFLLSSERSLDQEDALKYRRRNLEEQMVVILGSQARHEAKAFAIAVPFCLEWEGMSECPVDEANFADKWLKKRPHTSIAPFLHLFKAHRFRAGFECAKAAHENGLWPILAVRYRESLAEAKAFKHPLISCIADDIEAKSHVYIKGYGRP